MNDQQRSSLSKPKSFRMGEVKAQDITDHDVLCGRGKGIHIHEGNIRFREVISQRSTAYVNTADECSRRAIARKVVEAVELKGGRFLQKVSAAGTTVDATTNGLTATWVIVGPDKTMAKVKQALRDAAAKQNPSNRPSKSLREALPTRATSISSEQRSSGGHSDVTFHGLLQRTGHLRTSAKHTFNSSAPGTRCGQGAHTLDLITPRQELVSAYIADLDMRRQRNLLVQHQQQRQQEQYRMAQALAAAAMVAQPRRALLPTTVQDQVVLGSTSSDNTRQCLDLESARRLLLLHQSVIASRPHTGIEPAMWSNGDQHTSATEVGFSGSNGDHHPLLSAQSGAAPLNNDSTDESEQSEPSK